MTPPDSAGRVDIGVDAVALEVFSNRLLAIAEEMGRRLVRSSFSPNIKERRDCSTAIFAADGRLLAQAAHIPIHLGSLFGAVAAILEKFPLDAMRDGDAYIANDAYLCAGTHLNDISIVAPVVIDGRVRYFAACIGHHTDVGGPTPGSIAPDAASIFEEGIRIPATQVVRAGTTDRGLIELIAHNTREPDVRILDLDVQIAVARFGVGRLQTLAETEGAARMAALGDGILDYAKRRLAGRIRDLPDGVYAHTVWMDDDGLGGDPLPICATGTVAGDRLTFDFAGSGPQSRGGFNLLPSGVMATVGYAVKALLDPALPPNSGLFDAIDLAIPEGTILNPRFPAAVGARTTTCQKLASAIFGALQPALPANRAMAGSHDILASMVFAGERDDGGQYVYLETIGGGNGALAGLDGMDGAHCHITNSLNTPAEAVENDYPLRVIEYALVEGSGGAGAFRGGLGLAREIEAVGRPAPRAAARRGGRALSSARIRPRRASSIRSSGVSRSRRAPVFAWKRRAAAASARRRSGPNSTLPQTWPTSVSVAPRRSWLTANPPSRERKHAFAICRDDFSTGSEN